MNKTTQHLAEQQALNALYTYLASQGLHPALVLREANYSSAHVEYLILANKLYTVRITGHSAEIIHPQTHKVLQVYFYFGKALD